MHMLMYRCALAAVAEVHACVCRCARAVSVVRVVCVRARAIAGAVECGAHLSAHRMEMCVPVNPFSQTKTKVTCACRALWARHPVAKTAYRYFLQ